MTEKEIYEKMKKLLNKIRFTKSKKMKKLYMIDFITLQDMLLVSFNKDITGIEFEDAIMEAELLEDELDIESINEFVELNDITQKLANKTIDIFDEENFAPYYSLKHTKHNTNLLHHTLRDFIGTLGDEYLKKYSEIMIKGIPIGEIDDYTAGLCFNIFSDNEQFINLSSNHYIYDNSVSEIGFFQTIAHEFGHVIHLDKTNQVGKTKATTDAFCESISMMFEKMYIDFLEKERGININSELRNEYYLFLNQAIVAKAGSHAIDDCFLEPNFIIPCEYFTENYFDKYTYILNNNFLGMEYDRILPYFYGELIATKLLDEFGDDYKHATKELLDILIRLESSNSREMIEEINLNKIPKGITKTLKRIK